MKTIITFLVLALSAPAFAGTKVDLDAAEYQFSRSLNSQTAAKWKLGTATLKHNVRVLRCKYDFAVQGGAVGSANFKNEDGKDCVLPSKGIIRDVLFDVITAGTTSASGTFAVTAQSAGDLKAALAAASWTGLLAGIPVGTAATAIKLTADRTLVGTIATGALTAIKVYALIEYEVSDVF
jgi:hypothetical protein